MLHETCSRQDAESRRLDPTGELEGCLAAELDHDTLGALTLEHRDDRFDVEGLEVLRRLVSEKRGGRRDGHGIYAWDVDREVRLSESRLQMLTEGLCPPPHPKVRLTS